MSRPVNPAALTAAQAGHVGAHILFEGYFDSGRLNLWTGVDPLTVDGETYAGAGTLLAISDIRETNSLEAAGIVVTFSGVPDDVLSLALSEPYQGRRARVLLAFLELEGALTTINVAGDDEDVLEVSDGVPLEIATDPAGVQLGGVIGSPVVIFDGFIDTMSIDEDADTSKVSLAVESRLIELDRPRLIRYEDAEQQLRFPGDRGYQFVQDAAEKVVVWGTV